MQWFHRSDLWLSILLAGGILVTSITVIETAYQMRQLYSALQDLRAERDRLPLVTSVNSRHTSLASDLISVLRHPYS